METKNTESKNNEPLTWSTVDLVLNEIPTQKFIKNYIIQNELNAEYTKVPAIINGLSTPLYPHQQTIVSAMINMENTEIHLIKSANPDILYNAEFNAGVLSEKVGMGKTFDIIALILLQPEPQNSGYIYDHLLHKKLSEQQFLRGTIIRKKFNKIYHPTLIFVNKSVLTQWADTIKKYTALKLLIINNVRDLELFMKYVENKHIEIYDIILIKQGKVIHAVLPKNIIRMCESLTHIYIYSLIANLKGICWSRVVIDDYDTIKINESDYMINAKFTWYVSSTKKSFRIKQNNVYELSTVYSDRIIYSNYQIGNISSNIVLFDLLNLRNSNEYMESITKLTTPKYYAYIFKDPYSRLLNIVQLLGAGNHRDNEIIEMINGDAIETAAEQLGIKATNPAEVITGILGSHYTKLQNLSKLITFIMEQLNIINATNKFTSNISDIETDDLNLSLDEDTDNDNTYTIDDIKSFKPINIDYITPQLIKMLKRNLARYNTQKQIDMATLIRIKERLLEGECPICCMDLKEDCDGKLSIFKCCSVVICEVCTFTTVFNNKATADCPNCRTNINIQSIIYVSKDIDLNDLIEKVDAGEFKDNKDEVKVNSANYTKIDAIIDIINGKKISLAKPVNVDINQLMTGTAKFKDALRQKTLIFATHIETIYKIKSRLEDEKINYDILNGTAKNIALSIDKFNNNKCDILLISAARYCAGLNLQNATDLIFMHNMLELEIETQIAGRMMRLGRQYNAYFHYLMYENEFINKTGAAGNMRLL